MKKIVKYVFALVLAVAACDAAAQQVYYSSGSYYMQPQYLLIDWKSNENGGGRYNVGFHPFYLLNNGLKVDFEFELREPGQWLHFQLMINRASRHPGEGLYEGWSNAVSGDSKYIELSGIGAGFAYKYFLSNDGWYVSPGLTFNYYDVTYRDRIFASFREDGQTYYEYRIEDIRKDFYKVAFNVNFGKHFAISRNLFIDAFVGIGGSRAFSENAFGEGSDGEGPFEDYLSFGYTGMYLNGGLRLGWYWSR